MATNSDILKQVAEARGIPPRTLDQVRDTLAKAKEYGSDHAMACLMLAHGRMTDEARGYLKGYVNG